MNTVKRYSVEATGMGLHLEGHAVGTIERAVVVASDFDAALAREVALREELRLAKSLQTTTDAIVIMVDGQRDHWIEKHNALQQRLTGAEQLLRETLPHLRFCKGMGRKFAEKLDCLDLRIEAAFNPASGCEHSFHYFGDYPRRRYNNCNALEVVAEGEGS